MEFIVLFLKEPRHLEVSSSTLHLLSVCIPLNLVATMMWISIWTLYLIDRYDSKIDYLERDCIASLKL